MHCEGNKISYQTVGLMLCHDMFQNWRKGVSECLQSLLKIGQNGLTAMFCKGEQSKQILKMKPK